MVSRKTGFGVMLSFLCSAVFLTCLGAKCMSDKPEMVVTKIQSNHSFTVKTKGKTLTDPDQYDVVVLAGYTGPERGNPVYKDSAETLQSMVLNKNVEVETEYYNALGHKVGHVFLDGNLVAEELLKKGMGSYYQVGPEFKYGERLKAAQAEAQAAKRGMWAYQDVGDEGSDSGEGYRGYGN